MDVQLLFAALIYTTVKALVIDTLDKTLSVNRVDTRKGRGRGEGEREKGREPIPLPFFSLFPLLPIPYPLPLSTPATQATFSAS